MAPTNVADVYQPFGSGYYQLKFSGDEVVGRDTEGRRWVFQRLPALVDDDFYALVRIEDASGMNHVDLQYEVFDKFSSNPITTPQPDQISARELVLRQLNYSHGCARRLSEVSHPAELLRLIPAAGFEFVSGRPRTRSRLLQSLELLSSADTSCAASSVRPEGTYRIGYTTDPLTGQRRLASVDMLRPPVGVTQGPALPVVTYRYGTAVTNGELRYTQAEQITLPAGAAGINRGFAATLGGGGGGIYGHVRGFQDITG